MNISSITRLTAALALTSAVAFGGDSHAIKVGKVITMAGEPIENGIVLIESGRITAVGPASEIQIPWDAEVFEAPNLVAFPGQVEACTSQGMDRANESIDVAPFLNVVDSVDPVNFFYEEMLRAGITTLNVQQGNSTVIAGRGMIVKPSGMTVAAMTVRPEAGIKIAITPKRGKSRAVQLMILREAFAGLRRTLEGLVQEANDGNDHARREALAQGRDFEAEDGKGRAMTGSGWIVEGLEAVPRASIDSKILPLLAIVEGRISVYMACSTPMDVLHGLEIAKENGFLAQTVLLLGPTCWKVSDEIKAAGVRGVILSSTLEHTERAPFAEEDTVTVLPTHFAEKGIPFALASQNSTTESLWFQAARCVALGVDREVALAAITSGPAEVIGLSSEVGTIEKGKHGNLVLLSGDPLSLQTQVRYVFIEGELTYDRTTDTRLQHLMDGVQPEGTSADEPVVEDIHEEERTAGDK
jgi:imidazolonepropionase-like amidohydrolase